MTPTEVAVLAAAVRLEREMPLPIHDGRLYVCVMRVVRAVEQWRAASGEIVVPRLEPDPQCEEGARPR